MILGKQAVMACGAFILGGTLWGFAQSESTALPEKFAEWKKSYEKTLKETGEKAFADYDKELAKLEKECLNKQNYAGASRIREERNRAAEEIGIKPGGGTQPVSSTTTNYDGGAITLLGSEAELAGGVAYDKSTDFLTGWISDKSAARWKLPAGMFPGGYEVEISYACSAETGAEMFLREDIHTLKRKIPGSGSLNSTRTETVGTLRMDAGASYFQTSAVVGAGGFLSIKSVRLLPTS